MNGSQREIFSRGANVTLRLASAGSRFALLLVLARLLSPTEVGQYGLFLSTVLLGVALLGLEFHAYGLREIMREERARWSFIVQHCAVAWLVSYAVLAPVLSLTSDWWLVDGISPLWLLAVVAAEHLCQETSRFLVAMGRPILASALMFVRMGAWALLIIPWMWLAPSARQLDTVFAAWLIGATSALLLSAYAVRREARPWRSWPMNWLWIRNGLAVAGVYLIGSFVYRSMFTADRYLVQILDGSERLGIYVLYIGMATSIITIVEPAVHAFMHPRLVSAWQRGDRPQYHRTLRSYKISVLALSSALAVAIIILVPHILDWIGKTVYSKDLPLLWILVAAVWIHANSLPLDSALYAQHRDRELLYATTSTFVLFLAAAAMLSTWAPRYSVGFAFVIAFAVAYVTKSMLLKRPGIVSGAPAQSGFMP